MKTLHKVFAVFLALCICCAVPVSAETLTTTYDGFTYEYTLDADGNATIVSGNNHGAVSFELEIPETLDGHPVVALGDRSLTFGLVYPDVSIPGTVRSLGEDVFYEMTVHSIVFQGTESQWAALLATMDAGNDDIRDAVVTFVENGFHYGYSKTDGTAGIYDYFGPEDVTELIVPATLGGHPVVQLGESTHRGLLHNTSFLERIVIPDSVTELYEVCFSERPLKEIVLPSNLETMYNCLGFQNCRELESVTIPDTLRIYYGAKVCGNGNDFEGCDSLKDIYYGGTKTEWEALSLSESVTPLTGVTVHFGEESGQAGDFDDNGDLNMTDALKLFQGVSGKSDLNAIFSAMDVNADGVVNMFDALMLYEMIS